ncbi:peptidase domain-containing ABC transporter [Aliiglaciecola sp. 2_MG-2023]|uniref:peptidase domain-containing ABC transporter n=1 Tax=unclassified Aliiglaciecola TaxID=2593648 RepID=UPI0026E19762|nr:MULTISPECIES: peptidase domain-containing ABC transporter [unclassified Aliiglaciecola]MDO6713179.1 peptidase domain-containing ABC transporter [Aliiglaciecola sp. 2_MG-2023]MDO6754259.1 peptidase domain-containing ABC transporter [Aliiglaciecola sp. 1_MG-2023]
MNSTTFPRPESLLNFSSRHSLPCVLQTEASECGLACLAMISGFYGYEIDLTSIRSRFSISAHGATLKQIMQIAGQMELSSRALRLEMEQLTELQTPCILHWELKHFVVLKKVTRHKVYIHDPAIGERVLELAEVDKLFTGIALELTPTPAFEKGKQKRKLSLSHFWNRINGLKRSLAIILLLSIFIQVFALIQPYYMQTVIDDVILRSDLNLLTVLAFGFGLLLLIDTGTSYIRQTVILNLSSRLNIQMAANVFTHLIRLPLDYFSKRHMGDVVSRFGSLQSIRELLTTGLVTVFVDGLMATLTVWVMFLYDRKLTFIVLAIVFLYALLRYLFYKPLKRLTEESIVSSAKENSHFMESVRAIQTIKLFEKETDRQSQWQNKLAEALNKEIRLQRWNIGFDTANKILFGLENIIVIYFAALAVTNNTLSVGMLFAFVSYKSRFINSMNNLIEKWIEFRMLELHCERLADVVYTSKDPMVREFKNPRLTSSTSEHDKIHGEISLVNLGFSYSQLDAPVFQNINHTFESGSTIAIVGPSGCGKSTLMKCMMGLLQPTNGQVLVDGIALSNIDSYRQSIAAVMQDDVLLTGSIAENIACLSTNIDMQKIVYCAHLACIHEDIAKTSMQYNTLVGDMGANLSGGQKQRIILARALYKEPRILFLDEATSHLDVQNEMAINNHIKQLSITRVIIAHRPQTIASADKVLSLENGRLSDVTSSIKQP